MREVCDGSELTDVTEVALLRERASSPCEEERKSERNDTNLRCPFEVEVDAMALLVVALASADIDDDTIGVTDASGFALATIPSIEFVATAAQV